MQTSRAIRNAVRLAILALVMSALVAGALFAFGVASAIVRPPATVRGVEHVLGIALPAGATGVQLDWQPHRFGEYESFISFEIAPHELDALFADPAFQPRHKSRRPLAQVATASFGQQSMNRFVSRNRPAWWQPENGTAFVLAQRSRPGPDPGYTGPDMSWYIVDTSDPARLIVYAFVVEV